MESGTGIQKKNANKLLFIYSSVVLVLGRYFEPRNDRKEIFTSQLVEAQTGYSTAHTLGWRIDTN